MPVLNGQKNFSPFFSDDTNWENSQNVENFLIETFI